MDPTPTSLIEATTPASKPGLQHAPSLTTITAPAPIMNNIRHHLQDLPTELLEQIWFLSQNPRLSQTCQFFHNLCRLPINKTRFLLHYVKFIPPKALVFRNELINGSGIRSVSYVPETKYQKVILSSLKPKWILILRHPMFDYLMVETVIHLGIFDVEFLKLVVEWAFELGDLGKSKKVLWFLEEKGLFTSEMKTQMLIKCSMEGRYDLAEYLLSIGVEGRTKLPLDIHDDEDAALRMASKHGHASIVKLLLDHGADASAQDHAALCLACKVGHEEIVKLLISNGKSDIHARNELPLNWAAEFGNTSIVKLLISPELLAELGNKNSIRPAEIHNGDDYALRWAASRGYTSTVKLLLENGANVNAENDYALRHAVKYGHVSVVELLLKHGADPLANEGEAVQWCEKDLATGSQAVDNGDTKQIYLMLMKTVGARRGEVEGEGEGEGEGGESSL